MDVAGRQKINQEAQVFSHPGQNRFLEKNMIRKIKKGDISEKSDLPSHFRKDKKKKIYLQSSTDDFKLSPASCLHVGSFTSYQRGSSLQIQNVARIDSLEKCSRLNKQMWKEGSGSKITCSVDGTLIIAFLLNHQLRHTFLFVYLLYFLF